jgi:hypothetical protein
MHADDTALLLRRLARPGAIRVLLRHLGFSGPRQRLPGDGAPAGVASVHAVRRGTLVALVIVLRSALDPARLKEFARWARQRDAVPHQVLVIAEPEQRQLVVACDTLGDGLRHVVLDPVQLRPIDEDVLRELAARPDESDTAAAVRIARALDRSRMTGRFFRDVVAVRDLVAAAWSGVPAVATAQREGLALLLLSRLMFMYFLQKHGLLDGDERYLPRLFAEWRSRAGATSFFRGALRLLFFGVLNRRPEKRTDRARALGEMPYLNGGLFERHALEVEYDALDLPDATMQRVFEDVLEKYRITATDAAETASAGAGLGVDPEMLGRIFEGLMSVERRGRTGSFYTPSPIVDRLVSLALTQYLAEHGVASESVVARLMDGGDADVATTAVRGLRTAAERVRILDPACGSGAFLLGALARLTQIRMRLGGPDATLAEVRRDIVARSLHGVDLLEDAALICSLRLWLALVPGRDTRIADVQPLPNLDRRIRQGDALVDPLEIGEEVAGRPLASTTPAELRGLLAALGPAGARYLGADPETRTGLRRELQRLEGAVARVWLTALDNALDWRGRELAARAGDRDLFGNPATHAAAAARQLRAVLSRRQELAAYGAEMKGRARLPFFSFRVHFADAHDGFDIVLSNPPWIRAHRWPPQVRDLLRERYRVCLDAGWPYVETLAGVNRAASAQVDLSLLFLEKSLRLLAPRGTLGMLLPAKLLRSLYAGGARELLLTRLDLTALEDHSLDHRALFDVDAFTAVLLGRRRTDALPCEAATVRITIAHPTSSSLEFEVPAAELPLRRGDLRSPWLLAPPDCCRVLRRMQERGSPIGGVLTVRRGVMTGANNVLVLRDVEPKLGDLTRIRSEGWYRARSSHARKAYTGWVEGACIRPALRGADVDAWSTSTQRHVLWTPRNDDADAAPPRALRAYLQRHRSRLQQERDELGRIHRLSAHTLGHKVVWADLAPDLAAAAVPATARNIVGLRTPIVPLNTVYFIATTSAEESMLLAAYLNALPLRVMARAIAERAKDAHFRFFAWTISVLPLPGDWRSNAAARPLVELSREAHVRGGLNERDRARLDELVAASFDLTAEQLAHLGDFDRWLRGKRAARAAA